MLPSRRALSAIAAATVFVTCVPAMSAVAAPAGTEHRPDLQTIIPTNSFSVVNGDSGPELRYTHLIYNNGPGPLEIQPSYDQAIGGYRGRQLLFTHDEAGEWSQVREVRVPDVFVYHAEHGHFHFPLAAFGLYSVAADGGVGAPVARSPKIGFCIDDSYIYNSAVEHSGAFIGTRSSCADPSGLRGISVGGADEYDYRDPGQAIPIAGVPDGTYWFQAMSDPNNDIVEADESNNQTDVKVTIKNGEVTPGEVIHPDTTPPTGSISAPADASVISGAAKITVNSADSHVRKVEFVADGTVVGTSTDTTGPWTYAWDTTSVVDGEHWLSARITDDQGRTGNTGVTAVTVSNVTPPPTGDALALAASASQDGRNAQTATLGGLGGGELLLAAVSIDGPTDASQSATVSGGGLDWRLVRRGNEQPGTSELWKAIAPAQPGSIAVTSTPKQSGYDQSLTVLAFRGAAGVGNSSAAGSASGSAQTTVTTSRPGAWVFGVGHDWNQAIGRTVGAGQTLRHQWVDTGVGDTFWVQSQQKPTASDGTVVPIDDPAPGGSRWTLATAEILPAKVAPPTPDTTPPVVKVTDPEPDKTVRGTIRIGATSSDNVGVASVRFFVDGTQVGATESKPPFAIDWDTTAVTKGRHTITAKATDAAGNVGTSDGVDVTVDNSGPGPATIEVDASVAQHGRNTLKTTGLTTKNPGNLLLAFVGFDGPTGRTQSATVTGAGLNWTLVKRANTQSGTSEIWAAHADGTLQDQQITAKPGITGYDGLVTVMAFSNADGTGVAGAGGAPRGAPSIYLPAVEAASWVFAVGNDWDRAIARTPATGQVLNQQWVDTGAGDTFWVQSTAQPSAQAGLVTIADTTPTTDQWNYAAVEVRAAFSAG